ncbi:MAG TPA: carboxypeptidase regulatory-like domain-containing protein, partial [Thermomicrobiales bacterium]|nr:carboxypeptidase regulatory-like domain-containing protein [Thermomicrobiales bacterium]
QLPLSRLPTPDSRLLSAVRRLPPAASRLAYRWAGLIAAVGLAGGLLAGWGGWYAFALLAAALLAGGLAARARAGGWRWRVAFDWRALPRAGGWLALGLAVVALTYFATAEDLQTVLLRNTVERRAMQFWRAPTGDERFAAAPTGALAGTVRDAAGKPLAGAAVVVATVAGQTYSATSDAAGRYTIAGVPRGNYLPLAVVPGYQQGPALAPGGRVATVRPGRTSGGIDFALRPAAPLALAGGAHDLRLGAPATATVDNPEPSAAVRRTFSFANLGLTLDDGLVHEPPASLGPGPFPILLIIYPGEPRDWEGVSIPLAAKGYVVVSYFPERLLDLAGDLDDLGVLFGLVSDGRLSARGDPTRLVLVGGSVSTVYTYLLARELARGPDRWRLRALVQYGGIFDFFRYRYSWERGRVYIDPGISGLEYLLIALGRPDTRPEIYLRLSPRYDLGPGDLPPTLLIHAGRDVIVPVEQSELADATLTRLGTPHRLLVYPTLEHYLDTSTRNPADVDMLDQTLAFLRIYTGP